MKIGLIKFLLLCSLFFLICLLGVVGYMTQGQTKFTLVDYVLGPFLLFKAAAKSWEGIFLFLLLLLPFFLFAIFLKNTSVRLFLALTGLVLWFASSVLIMYSGV